MRETLEANPVARPAPPPEAQQRLRLDKGYDHAEPRSLAAEFGFTREAAAGNVIETADLGRVLRIPTRPA